MKEAELYPFVKAHFETAGYEVKAEIQHCDVLALKDGAAPLVVELKTALNITVVLQAVQRLQLTDQVYIGVWRKCSTLKRQRRSAIKLVRMLGLGLLAVDPSRKSQPVRVLVEPGTYKPRVSKPRQSWALAEFAARDGDPNVGGTATREGVVTAYRQRAERIATYLDANGPSKASVVAQAVDEPTARSIMYKNHYGWFVREGQGVYGLSPEGVARHQTR